MSQQKFKREKVADTSGDVLEAQIGSRPLKGPQLFLKGAIRVRPSLC
jgi:hypothetical protein